MKRDEKELLILETALHYFARFGYKKTSLEDIAGELGMTKSNLYFYAADKQDLYTRAVRLALSRWRESVAAFVDKECDVTRKFRVMSVCSFEYLAENNDLRAIAENDPSVFSLSPKEDRYFDINEEARDIIRSILTQGIRDGVFRSVDIADTTDFIFSIYFMFLIRAYVKSEKNETTQLFDQGLEIIIKGLMQN